MKNLQLKEKENLKPQEKEKFNFKISRRNLKPRYFLSEI